MKVRVHIETVKEIELPSEAFEPGFKNDFRLTEEAYQSYMGDESTLVDNGMVIAICDLDDNPIAEF